MKRFICLLMCGTLLVIYSCTKTKSDGELPQIEDGVVTQVTAAQIAWLEQVAAQKRDSMRIADSLSKITGIVDTNSLFNKKNKMIALVEVNDRYFPNVLYYQDAVTHKPIFDVAFAFSANININPATGRPFVKYNTQMTAMNSVGMLRYMQNQGMKVGLSLLGNWDPAGWTNFISIEDAKAFAQLVAIEVRNKGYSAILSDDEYTSGSYGTPLSNSYVVAMAEIKKLLPEVYVCYYIYGGNATGTYEGKQMGDWVDAAFSPYYPSNFVSQGAALGFPVNKVFAATSETDGSDADKIGTAQKIAAAGQAGIMFFNVQGLATSSAFYGQYLQGLRGQSIYVPAGKLVPDIVSGVNNTIK